MDNASSINWSVLKVLRVYVSRNLFELCSTKQDIARSAPLTGPWEEIL